MEWKGTLIELRDRTITGHATTAIGGRLVDLLITLDDGSQVMLSARGDEHGQWIEVDRSTPGA